MTTCIRVLVVEDDDFLLEALCAVLEEERDIAVVGAASDGNEAVTLALALMPDVILLDLMIPHRSGVEVIGALQHHHIEARILVLTGFADDGTVWDALRAGAIGYLHKPAACGLLGSAIRTVHRGAILGLPSPGCQPTNPAQHRPLRSGASWQLALPVQLSASSPS